MICMEWSWVAGENIKILTKERFFEVAFELKHIMGNTWPSKDKEEDDLRPDEQQV